MLVGSMANGLCATGGFCAGSSVVVDHQVRLLFAYGLPIIYAYFLAY